MTLLVSINADVVEVISLMARAPARLMLPSSVLAPLSVICCSAPALLSVDPFGVAVELVSVSVVDLAVRSMAVGEYDPIVISPSMEAWVVVVTKDRAMVAPEPPVLPSAVVVTLVALMAVSSRTPPTERVAAPKVPAESPVI